MYKFDPMSDPKFKHYVDKLLAIEDSVMRSTTSKDAITYSFSTKHPEALKVELTYSLTDKAYSPTDKDSFFYDLSIEGVDTGYWHTVELEDMGFHIELAIAALKGEVAYNRTLLGVKEVCFKSQDGWECTPTDGAISFSHYIKNRKHLRREIK